MMKLINGECLEEMSKLETGSIDLILTDPPYGTTACKWDTIIPLEPMWEKLKRLIKPNGAIVLFGTEPFSSYLRISNISDYKYDWIWIKNTPTGFWQAKRMPMKKHEVISVFYKKQCIYNPQMIKRTEEEYKKCYRKNNSASNVAESFGGDGPEGHTPIIRKTAEEQWYKNPTMDITIKSEDYREGKGLHPTQKPVALMEYLIKTYTNENQTVLDFTMGSGTTGVSAKNLNRNFVGIELDKEYFDIASTRINSTNPLAKFY